MPLTGRLTDAFAVHTQSKEEPPTEATRKETRERTGTALKKKSLQDQIKVYVDNHLTEKITLKIIAGYCGVSVSTVTQLFQKKLDITFHDYVTSRRMAASETLIREGVPLEQVGRQVGYQDHSTFYRAFRKHFGLSPREYRCRQTAGE